MATATRATKRMLGAYTSTGVDQLAAILELYFRTGVPDLDEMNVPDLFWKVDDAGFHVSGRVDGEGYHPQDGTAWMLRPRSGGETHVEILVRKIDAWLNGLDHDTKRRICGSMPTEEAYTRDPGLDLIGFTASTGNSKDPQHRVLTFVPAWV
jgi:hypothetical protein